MHIIQQELKNEPFLERIETQDLDKDLSVEGYNADISEKLTGYLNHLKKYYQNIYNESVKRKEQMVQYFENNDQYNYDLNTYKNKYYNESLADLVTNINTNDRLLEYEGSLIQQINPVFNDPGPRSHLFDYRTHFFAPEKQFLGISFSTFWFNTLVIWLMSLFFYLTLYFELLRKLIDSFSNMEWMRKNR